MNIFWLSKKEIFPRSFSKFLGEHNMIISKICTDPDRAINEFLLAPADLVIMDFSWYSSDVSGPGLLNQFLNIADDLKVVINTSYFQKTISDKYRELGACGYFTKNDSPEDIIACIKQHAAVSRLCRA